MSALQQIQQASSVEELRALLNRAETTEEQAAICLREAQLLGGPFYCPKNHE